MYLLFLSIHALLHVKWHIYIGGIIFVSYLKYSYLRLAHSCFQPQLWKEIMCAHGMSRDFHVNFVTFSYMVLVAVQFYCSILGIKLNVHNKIKKYITERQGTLRGSVCSTGECLWGRKALKVEPESQFPIRNGFHKQNKARSDFYDLSKIETGKPGKVV